MHDTVPEFLKLHHPAIEEMIHKHLLAVESLTESQLGEVIRQVLASGDLARHIRLSDSAQAVVYVPFAESERLRARIRHLEDLLEKHGLTCDEDTAKCNE